VDILLLERATAGEVLIRWTVPYLGGVIAHSRQARRSQHTVLQVPVCRSCRRRPYRWGLGLLFAAPFIFCTGMFIDYFTGGAEVLAVALAAVALVAPLVAFLGLDHVRDIRGGLDEEHGPHARFVGANRGFRRTVSGELPWPEVPQDAST